ncbi:uncharacterized protein MELLADRAFT_89211 [Melampsora larici-populina 98AG31]|uniref:Secreted protein n=1 Tax=Melampsora larici-populina (strain 98AG31 / pathotype 3-4-7) TaxID=747676 RepID=F4R5C1_MELLP|nr:uncharacterized protein MELLADRAFT_89211 [Melampsora larici-populina 98AG31]EGG12022.1 hypothetical protein MELLADRAFT_89211 [Melampsora larici-populina 98AG31]
MLFTFVLGVLVSLRSSHASLFITSPVQSTNCVGGKPCLLTWTNDKALPELSAYGTMNVGLWTGSETQQIELIKLGHIDPKESSTMNVIIPPKTGPNGNQYFIRMDQAVPDHPGDPYQAFSAHFDLSGMTGGVAPVVPPSPPHPEPAKGVIGGPNSSIIVAVPPSSPTGAPVVGRIAGTGSSNSVSTASLPVLPQTPSASFSSPSPMATPQTPPSSITSAFYYFVLAILL